MKVLYDLGLAPCDEPFTNLLTQGMVLKDGAKMSKSKGNVVSPEEIIEHYGADTARLFILFAAPPERDLDWSDQGVEGAYRFINRVWRLYQKSDGRSQRSGEALAEPMPTESTSDLRPPTLSERALRLATHRTILKVTEDISTRFNFNTAVSAIMELVNAIYQYQCQVSQDQAGARSERKALAQPMPTRMNSALGPRTRLRCCGRAWSTWPCCWPRSRRTWRRSCGQCWASPGAYTSNGGRSMIRRPW